MATTDSVQPRETPSDQAGLKDCQWFVMSPRTSLESSASRPRCETAEEEQDENAVPNTAPDRLATKGAFAATKTKMLGARIGQASPNSGRHSARQQPLSARQQPLSARREQQVLPCMRQPGQSTSPRTSRKSLGETSRSPGRMMRGTPSRSTLATPEASEAGDESGYQPSFASMSMYSESQYSCTSRLDQLSRRSFSRRHLSSEELLQQEVEDKKRDLAKMRKQNNINCHKARQPDVNFGTLGKMTTKVTMPKEFTLSANTPRLKESRSQSDNEDSVSSAPSARRSSHGKAKGMTRSSSAGTAPGLSSTKKWAPQLTVPQGPTCADPEQVKLRRSLSCPPEDMEADEQSVGTCLSARSTGTCFSARSTRTSTGPSHRPSTPERSSQGVPSNVAAVAERRRSRSEQQATQSVRPATPERCAQAARPATPDRSAQPVRRSTPERSSRPVRRATPEHGSEAATQSTAGSAKGNRSEEKARAERARQQAMLKNQEQAAKRNEHCIFRKSQAASSQVEDADAPPSARAAPTSARTTPLRERLNHSSSGSIGTGAETGKAVKRRPSFGSTARRPCC